MPIGSNQKRIKKNHIPSINLSLNSWQARVKKALFIAKDDNLKYKQMQIGKPKQNRAEDCWEGDTHGEDVSRYVIPKTKHP